MPPPHLTLALSLCLLLSGCAGGSGPPRVIVLGLDGVDPDVVDLLIAEDKLPNFARLKRDGAFARLYSPPPLLSPIIWTTIATGRSPSEHGIGHFTTVDPETGQELPVTSSMRRVSALWNIFSEAERKVAVVGWWATWPAESVNGQMISDRTAYHFLMGQHQVEQATQRSVAYPEDALDDLSDLIRKPGDLNHEDLAGFVQIEPSELDAEFQFDDELSHFRWALAAAKTYRDIGLHLWRTESPDLLMVYVEGVDTTSHLFGHLHRQGDLVGELAGQQQRFGLAVERMYEFADSIVGDYLAVMDERTTLVVLSDHGFKLGELPADPSKTRDMRRVSEAYHREHGILFVYGAGVPAGSRIVDSATIDITPTVLALAGLPVAEDMSGEPRGDWLSGYETIASYDPGGPGERSRGQHDGGTDSAVLEHLESLGYIGSSATATNDRNLANIMLREGRYEEAALAFTELLEDDPEEAELHAALGSALGQLGRTDDALQAFERAIELDPLLVVAYFNRGRVHERAGDVEAAIEDFRTALRYRSEYDPARRALQRLEVGAVGRQPETAEEIRAATLLQEAGALMRRGDYEAAQRSVAEAQRLAPDVAAVYQAQANLAYLRGDRDAAVTALTKALELEPANALFQENLRRLRQGS